MPKFESTLHLSKIFQYIQIVMLTGAVMSSYMIFSLLINMLITFGLLGYCIWNFYSQAQWQAIGQDSTGWYFKKAGETFYVIFSGDSTVTALVCLLRFKPEGQFFKQSCLIFKDTMSADHYHQLRLRLKYFT